MEMQRKPISKKFRMPKDEYNIYFFFKSKYDSVGYMFEQNNILTVFELYVMELFRDFFSN